MELCVRTIDFAKFDQNNLRLINLGIHMGVML